MCSQTSKSIGKIGLKETFNAVQMLENKLVAGVELDPRLSIDAFGVEFCA